MNLGDVMILIAAMAVGFAATRPLLRNSAADLWREPSADKILRSISLTLPCFEALTVAFLVIRFRPPRRGRRQLMRQPGTVACCAATLLATTTPLVLGIFLLKWYHDSVVRKFVEVVEIVLLEIFPLFVGYVVIVAWGLLALSGRWRREAGWIDTSGILIGLYLIFASILSNYLV